MKVLVTGGAGFIGSHLVDSLLADGHNVIVVDNFDPFYDRSIKEKNIEKHLQSENYTLFEKDIRDREAIDKIFNRYKPEVVVHLAAKAGVRPSVENPNEYVEVNINGTVNLLDASVKYKVKKFIFASSSSVYGLNEKVPFSEDDPILNQASPYGATKAAGESLCRSYSNCYGLPIVALRFFTVYGPRQRPDLAIHKFAKKILNNEPITLFGDGSTCRDYTYIDDIIYGIRASIDYCLKGYEVFNLGNDRPIQLLDLVKNLEKVLGKNANIQWLPEQTGDVPRTWASVEKSKKLLGYEPKVDIMTGLANFVSWINGK
ncbi:SDR family NAD(P)-dependent oxidoreductase [Geobacillus proteiniphilus]|uniref:SDR family NAD(P)-dependent oxidoreductase n=1 Tax=Geobacillus proteiniphilus TaxID=860353 RepID=A0ABY9MF14_9BACL|nr:SDR family NAD(P)-dependent oxidoreductase [Geobacillus proteiniphilus]WMJ16346.1 SDR family NAD(P)-dependent oxidoreductase [Geobacillus proteiniphilus]